MKSCLATFPLHIAIIMDGNGRWAKARHRPRVFGHQAGIKTVRCIVEDAADMGIRYLTLYSFSTENWSRPKSEISALFNLLKQYVNDDLDSLHENGVQVRIAGSRRGLTPDILEIIHYVETKTHDNTEFYLNIAFNYGGRDEILRAAAKAVSDGKSLDTLSDREFETYLDTSGFPSPDLVIRTGGEKRISNFLIWQAAYAEFVFTDVLWPDFTRTDLEEAVDEYLNRERRFGALRPAEVA
ncbi:MAG: di-trans,poly-cis-decaprenylcistransferase [Hyphomonadaceae bacterium]|nr:di-trans,poly-cis-decaprenylcistransferase [Hyphomonadaceae bacterium]MBC6412905.1 di-trans,poly-cis-decaprenylcistransferase [Hyphomonadaceae bacterium]